MTPTIAIGWGGGRTKQAVVAHLQYLITPICTSLRITVPTHMHVSTTRFKEGQWLELLVLRSLSRDEKAIELK